VPLSELLSALERKMEARVAEELERAKAEAEELLRVAAAEEKEGVHERVAEHASEIRGRAEKQLVEARRKAEARVLKARRELLDRVFEGAFLLQNEAREWPSYHLTLARDVRALLALTAGETVTLLCPAADRPEVVAVAGTGTAVDASPEMTAGIRLRSADGRLEVDCSLAARLAAARASLAIKVVQQLEGSR
jgi:vacuolar-type H+-ATPase subunit E/Vma4